MSTLWKQHSDDASQDARAGIVQELRKQYDTVVRETLPATLTALVALYESVESVARIKAKLDRLRRGRNDEEKDFHALRAAIRPGSE